MAKNTGSGGRIGAVKDRTQLFDPNSGLWSIFTLAGDYLRTKKSPGPWKGVRIGPPKGLK